MSEVVELADELIDYGPCGGERSLTLIIYEIFRQKSGTDAVKTESKSKPPLLANVRFFPFPVGSVCKTRKPDTKKRGQPLLCRFLCRFLCCFSHVDIFRIYSLLSSLQKRKLKCISVPPDSSSSSLSSFHERRLKDLEIEAETNPMLH
jgi:hypothetical protein